jgi:hypothetical protein
VYTPCKPIHTACDVNMFLTSHKLLHASERVPRVPMSISHCWINTVLERQKLQLNDLGVQDIEVSHSLINPGR